jgi:hypothetical protein
MAEVQNYIFTLKEIAGALVKQQGIHEGLWAIYVEFGIGAGHIPAGPNTQEIVPAAVVPIVKMGIQRAEQPTPLTVDAAEVNPKTDQSTERRKGRRATRQEI